MTDAPRSGDGVLTQAATVAVDEIAAEELDLRLRELRLGDQLENDRLREELPKEGWHAPVIATTGIEDGKLVVVDGFKRVQVARELGQERVPVRIVATNGPDSLRLMLKVNAGRTGLCELEQGLIIQDLHRRHRLSQDAIGRLVGHHRSWVCRRLAIVERLDKPVLDDLKLGLITRTTAGQLSLLPRCTQSDAAQAIAQHRLTTRQSTKLVQKLRAADPETVQRVLASPLEFLCETPRHQDHPGLSHDGNVARSMVLRLQAAAHRLLELERNRAPRGLRASDHEVLAPLVHTIAPVVRDALAMLEDTLENADATYE